jgi:hypothetical protein
VDLSEFIFAAELTVEFVENGWTTADSLMPMLKEYNDAITKIRKKEYVYWSWVGRYWGEDKVLEFSKIAEAIKEFDQAIHSLNDEFEQVNIKRIGKSKALLRRLVRVLQRLSPVATARWMQ